LPTPAAIKKAEREVEEFRKFQQLTREFLGTNAEICRLRPLDALFPGTQLRMRCSVTPSHPEAKSGHLSD